MSPGKGVLLVGAVLGLGVTTGAAAPWSGAPAGAGLAGSAGAALAGSAATAGSSPACRLRLDAAASFWKGRMDPELLHISYTTCTMVPLIHKPLF